MVGYQNISVKIGMVDEADQYRIHRCGADIAVSSSFLQKADKIIPYAECLPDSRKLGWSWRQFRSRDRGFGRVDLERVSVDHYCLPRALLVAISL